MILVWGIQVMVSSVMEMVKEDRDGFGNGNGDRDGSEWRWE